MSQPSITENGDGYFLTRESMQWFLDCYLGPDRSHGDPTSPEVSPLYVDDLAGVAPAHVITAEYDPLRDEGDAYAAALDKAGVPITHDTNPGMIHGFFGMSGLIPAAEACVQQAAQQLGEALARR